MEGQPKGEMVVRSKPSKRDGIRKALTGMVSRHVKPTELELAPRARKLGFGNPCLVGDAVVGDWEIE